MFWSKDVEFNPLKGQVDEIDFQALVSNEKVHSVAEIVLVGHEKDAGGVLEQLLEEGTVQRHIRQHWLTR